MGDRARGTTKRTEAALVLRRAKTGEILLSAGGVYDHGLERFTDERPRFVKVIDVEESQVPFVRWFATFLQELREGLPRDTSVALAEGGRRGGKTFAALFCAIALLLDLPRLGNSATVGWVISVSYQERSEIDQAIKDWIPAAWYRKRESPHFDYTFITGATLRHVSADDPDTLRQGRCDVALFNEAQKMAMDALINGVFGTADKGGIALLAANPPRKKRGEWVMRLKQAIDEKKADAAGARYFHFDARKNTKTDQPARARVSGIVRLLAPAAAKADDEGLWLPIGSRAYASFDPLHNTGPAPQLGDCTGELIRHKIGKAYPFWGAVDFQRGPGNAGVLLRAYGDPRRPIYFAYGEICRPGVEDEFLDEVWDYGGAGALRPETLFWIGDASGDWQDDQRIKGRCSFDYFRKRGWRIEPPQRKRSDRGDYTKNPDVTDRRNLVNRLALENRLVVDEATCPQLVLGLRDCELGANGKPKAPAEVKDGWHPHITDALGYGLWWMEPAPVPAAAAPSPRNVRVIDSSGGGPRIL